MVYAPSSRLGPRRAPFLLRCATVLEPVRIVQARLSEGRRHTGCTPALNPHGIIADLRFRQASPRWPQNGTFRQIAGGGDRFLVIPNFCRFCPETEMMRNASFSYQVISPVSLRVIRRPGCLPNTDRARRSDGGHPGRLIRLEGGNRGGLGTVGFPYGDLITARGELSAASARSWQGLATAWRAGPT